MDQAISARPDLSSVLHLSRVDMLNDQGLRGMALNYLNDQLALDPNNTRLLYGRAMQTVEQNLKAAEADLLAVLALEPDNASALNALGYSYADAGINLDEALKLIGRALAERPDDAAILDSMGWVHFRLGNLDQAIDWLQRAYAQLPDGEIAAHLGEALFAAGRTADAEHIWQTALEAEPDHPVLIETVERLTQPRHSLLNQK